MRKKLKMRPEGRWGEIGRPYIYNILEKRKLFKKEKILKASKKA